MAQGGAPVASTRRRGTSWWSSQGAAGRGRAFSRSRPTDWRPTTVRNPEGLLDTHFTDSTAWELIAARLEAGEEVEVIELRKPPGAKGYVIKIDMGADVPVLYVKLQLGAGRILGRSFTTRNTDGHHGDGRHDGPRGQ